MGLVRINHDERLYVLGCESGYSCLGFDVMAKRHAALNAELATLGLRQPPVGEVGTEAAHAAYEDATNVARLHNAATGYRFKCELSPQLVGLEGKRVEVVDAHGEGKPRRFLVGRSTGWMPCHLEVHNRRSTGGGAAWHSYRSVRVVAGGRR